MFSHKIEVNEDGEAVYESYWHYCLRAESGKVHKGILEFGPYSRMFVLMRARPDLEAALVEAAEQIVRAEDCSFDEAVIEATHEIAFQADIDLPEDYHESSDDEFAFELAWFNSRKWEWKKQQGNHA